MIIVVKPRDCTCCHDTEDSYFWVTNPRVTKLLKKAKEAPNAQRKELLLKRAERASLKAKGEWIPVTYYLGVVMKNDPVTYEIMLEEADEITRILVEYEVSSLSGLLGSPEGLPDKTRYELAGRIRRAEDEIASLLEPKITSRKKELAGQARRRSKAEKLQREAELAGNIAYARLLVGETTALE